MKKLIVISVIGLFSRYGCAQASVDQSGARSMGMANASVSISDAWAVFNNIGALAGSDECIFGFSYLSLYGIDGFNAASACMSLPVNDFNYGFGVYYFGDAVYNESRLTAGASHQINFVSIGVSATYLRYNVLEFSSAGGFMLEVGGKAELLPGFHIAACIFNVNKGKAGGKAAPVLMKAGVSYQPGENLMINIDLEKETTRPTALKPGIEFTLVPQIRFRSGFSTNSGSAHFGLGFRSGFVEVDYAVSNHRRLGLSNQVSANIQLRREP